MLGALKKQDVQVVYVGDPYQQIYEWRGAVNALEQVETTHHAALTLSFRFGSAIAEAASRLLARLGEKEEIRGNPDVKSRLGCSDPDAILCRTNAGVIEQLIKALDNGERPFVVGGNGEIIRLLKAVSLLKAGQPVDLPEFYGFADWREVVEFSESDEGAHLRMLVKLVEAHGERFLLDILTEMNASEHTATLVLSTVHKAKGRQWRRIVVNDDFSIPGKPSTERGEIDPSELRLMYVALTRAQTEVQVPAAIASLIEQPRTRQAAVFV